MPTAAPCLALFPRSQLSFFMYKALIKTHVALNGSALVMVALLHSVTLPLSWWPVCTAAYCTLLALGTLAGVAFSVRNPAHDAFITLSFFCMGLGSLLPGLLALGSLMQGAMSSHGHYLALSFAALFGAGFLFRAMARLMLLVPPRRKKLAWTAIIWTSWLFPTLQCQWALSSYGDSTDL